MAILGLFREVKYPTLYSLASFCSILGQRCIDKRRGGTQRIHSFIGQVCYGRNAMCRAHAERCECAADIARCWCADCTAAWKDENVPNSYTARRRFLERRVGEEGPCLLTGKNGPPLAVGVVERWCAKVEGAYSHRLNEVLLRSPEEGRVMLLSFLTHLKGRFFGNVCCFGRRRLT
jgi:hypothetical protein